MLISQKHYCTEHQRSCYVNGSNHLHLTPQHLSTWAASIVSFAWRNNVSRNVSHIIIFCVTFRVIFCKHFVYFM